MHGQADCPTGVGDASGDGLTDPPGGIRGELKALSPVELFDGVHQAQVALLDEIQQRQPGGLILLGNRDDQPQVRLDEGALGVLATLQVALELTAAGRCKIVSPVGQPGPGLDPGLNLLGEADLTLFGQQRILADVGEVQADEVFLVPFDPLLGHPRTSSSRGSTTTGGALRVLRPVRSATGRTGPTRSYRPVPPIVGHPIYGPPDHNVKT